MPSIPREKSIRKCWEKVLKKNQIVAASEHRISNFEVWHWGKILSLFCKRHSVVRRAGGPMSLVSSLGTLETADNTMMIFSAHRVCSANLMLCSGLLPYLCLSGGLGCWKSSFLTPGSVLEGWELWIARMIDYCSNLYYRGFVVFKMIALILKMVSGM